MALLGSLALEALRGLRYPSTDDASVAVPADLPGYTGSGQYGRGKRVGVQGHGDSSGDDPGCQV